MLKSKARTDQQTGEECKRKPDEGTGKVDGNTNRVRERLGEKTKKRQKEIGGKRRKVHKNKKKRCSAYLIWYAYLLKRASLERL